MEKKVEIISREEVFRKYVFRIEEVHLRHSLYDGSTSDEIVRLNLDRGDSVAALIHLKDERCFVFTEQFRFPTYDRGPGWLLEVPAGMRDGDEEPAVAMKREVLEELGFHVAGPMHHLSTFYLSPGGTAERLHLFDAGVEAA